MIQYSLTYISTLSTTSLSDHLPNDAKPPSYQPDQLPIINKYPEQLLVSPRSGGKDRDRLDPHVSILTKIRVTPIEEPISKPSKITSSPEEKHIKISPVQHTIRKCWTKHLNHRGEIPQEDSRMDH